MAPEKIRQCRFASSVTHFKQGFQKKWGLSDYKNNIEACVFVGVYNEKDIEVIKSHRGFKVIIFCGQDIFNYRRFIGDDCYFITGVFGERLSFVYGNRVKVIQISMKDYSEFKPVPLGDKIYCYMRSPSSQGSLNYALLERIMKKVGKDRFLIGHLGNPMETVINKFYKKSFINLQFNPVGGLTSVYEMAHMGRRSISNYASPFTLSYETEDDIVKLIETEAQKIGTLQPEVSEQAVNNLKSSDEWLYAEYYF